MIDGFDDDDTWEQIIAHMFIDSRRRFMTAGTDREVSATERIAVYCVDPAVHSVPKRGHIVTINVDR